MRILVLSDSHSGLSFARLAIRAAKPDVMIHLGDYYDDGMELHEEFPKIRFFQVAGNCDWNSAPLSAKEMLIPQIDGVRMLLTHGHRQHVKEGTGELVRLAQKKKVGAVLYGHTHRPDCFQDPSGMWVMNPGCCSVYSGSVGLIETSDGKILSCRVLSDADLARL